MESLILGFFYIDEAMHSAFAVGGQPLLQVEQLFGLFKIIQAGSLF